MFEKRNEPLIPISKFFIRLLYSIIFSLFFIILGLGIGMVGYHHFENMSWVDAFVNAAMILSSMGPVSPLVTTAAKIFAGCYALFSGIIFLVIIGIILAPIAHRFLHKFHLDADISSKKKLK